MIRSYQTNQVSGAPLLHAPSRAVILTLTLSEAKDLRLLLVTDGVGGNTSRAMRSPAIWYKVRMAHRQLLVHSASIGAYFLSTFALLYWFAGHGFLRSTFILSLACTIWDSFACVAGIWVGQNLMKLQTAAPLLGGAITGAGLASMPFWIYRGYGHFLFEGTWGDINCFFVEGAGIAFPFVVAPVLGFLTLLHGVWLRTTRVVSVAPHG